MDRLGVADQTRPNAEELGFIPKEVLTGDRLFNEVTADPDVRPFFLREDPSLPDTLYELALALLACQERMEVQAEQRVFMQSARAETLLTPLLFGMDRDLSIQMNDGANPGRRVPVLTVLREKLRPYRELTDTVVCSILRDCSDAHPHIDRLREAARTTAAAA
jgi:hypothetical protein